MTTVQLDTTDPMAHFGLEAEHKRERAPGQTRPKTSVSVWSLGHAGVRRDWLLALLAFVVSAQAPIVVLWGLEFRRGPVPVLVVPAETVRHQFDLGPAAPAPATPSLASIPHAGEPIHVTVVRPSPSGALSGWVDIDVPVSLKIFEEGRFLGTTEIDRIMLPVGEHVLLMSSDELRFSIQRTVIVKAGATTTVQFDLPRALLSINARPWAEAWVDGERVGETPVGNLVRPIGRHEVVLRHPQFGERRESVLVTLNQPARLSVDLRQGNQGN